MPGDPPDRDVLEVDVLIVGAGPAGLAAAYRLGQLAGNRGLAIAVLEKGKEVGAHIASGAVMDPAGIDELVPDWRERGAPVESDVIGDDVFFLSETGQVRVPIVPPPLRNHGNVIVSLNRLVRWMGRMVEETGVDIFAGFSGSGLLVEDGRLTGVRTGDKGIDREGNRKANFEPGIDVRAKVTILAEGVRGSLAKAAIRDFGLDRGSDRNPQVYAVGVKEIWEAPAGERFRGRVVHTMGHPLTTREFGGGFIYGMSGNLISVGLVVGLDYADPRLDPHSRFQRFKAHPFVSELLSGGALRSYAAKAIPEGGYWARPDLAFDGGMLVGDTGGLLNAMRLKGIHMAIKSGMLAAETAFDALRSGDVSAASLSRYTEKLDASWVGDELWKARNFRQGFEGGFWKGIVHAGLQTLTGGRGVRNRYPSAPGHTKLRKLSEFDTPPPSFRPDGTLTFDKLTDVYHSGTAHDEDQPVHLVVTEPDVCHERCTAEYGNPCQYFCPAAVYHMEPSPAGDLRLQIDASNCVHCKTCDIMDPYQVIDWICPEGGGGPGYEST